MAILPRRHQIQNNTTITANGNSGSLSNLGRDLYPNVEAIVEVTGAVTGTTPTLDIYIESLQPSGNWLILSHFTQITATTGTTPVATNIANVMFQTLRVRWVVGGTTPSFAGCYIDLYFASPSA